RQIAAFRRGRGAVRRPARPRARVHREAFHGGRLRRGTARVRRRFCRGAAAARGRAAAWASPREGPRPGAAAGRAVLSRSPDHRVNADLLPLSRISDALAARSVAPEALLESCLARVKALDGKLHAFLRLTESEARSAARAAGQRRAAG